jgi:hypothetical protein
VNLYGFCYNRPFQYFDYLGREPKKNPDGSEKEPGQNYPEIEKQQQKNRQAGDDVSIASIEGSRKRDQKEMEDEAERIMKRRRGEATDNECDEPEQTAEEWERKAWEEYQRREAERKAAEKSGTPSIPTPPATPATPDEPQEPDIPWWRRLRMPLIIMPPRILWDLDYWLEERERQSGGGLA